MENKLNPDLNTIDWLQLTSLFEKVGWGHRPPEQINKAFEKSSHSFFVFDKQQIIAFGRTMDDGKYYALLVDVVVHPEYQGKKLGTLIINTLREQLQGYNFVTLTSAPGKADFYKKLGWKKQSSAYIWPLNKRQEAEHCENI